MFFASQSGDAFIRPTWVFYFAYIPYQTLMSFVPTYNSQSLKPSSKPVGYLRRVFARPSLPLKVHFKTLLSTNPQTQGPLDLHSTVDIGERVINLLPLSMMREASLKAVLFTCVRCLDVQASNEQLLAESVPYVAIKSLNAAEQL